MRTPWITLLCCAAATPAAWFAGRAFAPADPPSFPAPPAVTVAPAPVETPAPPPAAPSPVLPELLALAAAADGEPNRLARQQRLHEAARLLANATAVEARELFHTTADPFLKECSARRWAELEPQAALDHLLALDAQQISQLPASLETLSRAVFQGWAHRDPAAALAAAEPLRLRKGFHGALHAAACQAISENIATAMPLCAKYSMIFMGDGGERESRLMWEHQPAAFTRALFTLPEDSKIDSYALRYGIESAKAWAVADTAGFTAWAAQHLATGVRKHDGFQESRFHAELFGLLLAHDPDAAGEAFAATPGSELQNKMREQYVAHIAAEDPQAGAAWLEANIHSGRDAAWRLWAEATAKSAGHEQAAALALALPPGKAREAAAGAALYAWAGKDLDAALTWAKAQPSEAGSPAPITHLKSLWLLRHGEEAARFILSHPHLGWSNSTFRSATLKAPLADAIPLIRHLPGDAAIEAAKAVGERFVDGSHRLSEITELTAEQQAIAVRTAAKYMDKEKAATWVAALPAGPLRVAGEAGLQGGQ